MKIKKVEICGFKSFVDRTVVLFDHDVTAIVGPNGCGKSNVVDAIRWTMGEQSAKNLRGKSMDDVIFNGSETRGPHSFAEVTLTFDNTDGLASPEYRAYAEIAVTRRLDRQGNSDYFINKTPVRLMDVTELFLGTGIGAKAYSIIEQGKIGYIVSAKPEDRRGLIEEAAGITKFKAKKKAAERKMDATRQNLLRIGDIVAEIEKNLASLKRQAQKAERYKAYRAEIRDLELLVASHRWMELTVTRRVIDEELTQASGALEGHRYALRVREAELEGERLAVQRAESEVERAQRVSYELDNSVRMLEGKVEQHKERLQGLRDSERLAERELEALSARRAVLAQERDGLLSTIAELEEIERTEQDELEREVAILDERKLAAQEAEQTVSSARSRVSESAQRIARAEAVLKGYERRRDEARTRLDRMRSEREELEGRLVELAQEADELRTRLEGLREGKNTTAERKEQLETELKDLRAQITESERTVDKLRSELAEKRSRLRSLEEITKKFEGVGAGVRSVMTRFGNTDEERAQKGVLGLVADRIECPEAYTQALAGALGERLQHVVVSDVDAGLRVLEFLEQGDRGRATAIPRTPRRVVAPLAVLPQDEGIVGWLADLVRGERETQQDEALVRHLLEGVLVVRDLASAKRLYDAGVQASTFVTERGEVLGAGGVITGGRGEQVGAHMIAVKREIRDLHGIVAKLDAEMTAAVARHGELRNGIASRQAALDSARNEAHDAEIAIVKADKDLRRAEDELNRTRQRVEKVAMDADDLAMQLADAQGEGNDAQAEIESASKAKHDAEGALESNEMIYEERRSLVEAQSARVTDVRVRAAQARQRAEGDRQALDRLDKSVQELGEREKRLRGDLERGAKQQGETAGALVVTKEELVDKVERAMKAHEVLGAAREKYDVAKLELGTREADLKEIRSKIDEGSRRVSSLTIEERELAMAIEHLLDQVNERHRVDLRRVLGDYHFRDLPDDSVKTRIDELLRLVERMGEINLTAIEEYEEQSKRFEYLNGQKLDLEQALDQLDKAIKQMNRESKKLFREAFDAINERFQQVFPRLFGGGKAELKLTNADDLLETGIDILAQPPGKKIGSIELMSGGEKALTAVSLIFSIFQYKPSPFCLLDEVDAPLDEANIGRYCEAIRAMTKHSQFIVITHSKKTMQMADVLYGVTMETPGISKLVSVELRQKQRQAAPDASHAVA
ncbi:chromosome segregation protein SMC [Sandaracinus amylolyticus]|uniref:Chromosome partition protein Smc n=1 Tax=Sandaracinus amylolyticus TaxID=927083 RepID=A0A0F6YHS4_9BACT|nr:chromosome segregation protein SMC [Sandaracinus amylolyticus]AKF05403.1 Chromosome partition protein smc [Sandaracinus amylolyticus]